HPTRSADRASAYTFTDLIENPSPADRMRAPRAHIRRPWLRRPYGPLIGPSRPCRLSAIRTSGISDAIVTTLLVLCIFDSVVIFLLATGFRRGLRSWPRLPDLTSGASGRSKPCVRSNMRTPPPPRALTDPVVLVDRIGRG